MTSLSESAGFASTSFVTDGSHPILVLIPEFPSTVPEFPTTELAPRRKRKQSHQTVPTLEVNGVKLDNVPIKKTRKLPYYLRDENDPSLSKKERKLIIKAKSSKAFRDQQQQKLNDLQEQRNSMCEAQSALVEALEKEKSNNKELREAYNKLKDENSVLQARVDSFSFLVDLPDVPIEELYDISTSNFLNVSSLDRVETTTVSDSIFTNIGENCTSNVMWAQY